MHLTEAQKRVYRDAFLVVHDTFVIPRLPLPEGPPTGVLIVKLDGIGDLFLWLSAARALHEHYKDCPLTLVVDEPLADFAAELGFFDDVISVRRLQFTKDLTYRREILARIRSRRFELAMLPCHSRVRYFRNAEAIIRAACATQKVGMQGEKVFRWQRWLSARWYDRLFPSADGALTEIERIEEIMRALGIVNFEAGLPNYKPSSAPADDPSGDPVLKWIKPYYVLIPGAGSILRKWPPDRFARLAGRLHKATGWRGIICGGPGETELGKFIIAHTEAPLLDLTGCTSLTRMVELIAGAEIVVGNETGGIHIAAAVSTPSVCVTGGGHYGRFVPYDSPYESERPVPSVVAYRMPCFNCDWTCKFRPNNDETAPCILGISEESVWLEVNRLLREIGGRDDSMRVNHLLQEP